jgi:hypothetical protein
VYVGLYVVINILEELALSMFRAQKIKKGFLDTEAGNSKLF